MSTDRGRAAATIVIISAFALLAVRATASDAGAAADRVVADLGSQHNRRVAERFHYAATVSTPQRSDDWTLVAGGLRVVFTGLVGLPKARREPLGQPATAPGVGTETLGIFAGDASDWNAESSKYSPTLVSYSIPISAEQSMTLAIAYVRPETTWEILELRLSASTPAPGAFTALTATQARFNDYLRAQASGRQMAAP